VAKYRASSVGIIEADLVSKANQLGRLIEVPEQPLGREVGISDKWILRGQMSEMPAFVQMDYFRFARHLGGLGNDWLLCYPAT
jgi:hypothetical protein